MKSIKTSEKLSFNWHGKNEASYLADIPVKSNIYPQKDKVLIGIIQGTYI